MGDGVTQKRRQKAGGRRQELLKKMGKERTGETERRGNGDKPEEHETENR